MSAEMYKTLALVVPVLLSLVGVACFAVFLAAVAQLRGTRK